MWCANTKLDEPVLTARRTAVSSCAARAGNCADTGGFQARGPGTAGIKRRQACPVCGLKAWWKSTKALHLVGRCRRRPANKAAGQIAPRLVDLLTRPAAGRLPKCGHLVEFLTDLRSCGAALIFWYDSESSSTLGYSWSGSVGSSHRYRGGQSSTQAVARFRRRRLRLQHAARRWSGGCSSPRSGNYSAVHQPLPRRRPRLRCSSTSAGQGQQGPSSALRAALSPVVSTVVVRVVRAGAGQPGGYGFFACTSRYSPGHPSSLVTELVSLTRNRGCRLYLEAAQVRPVVVVTFTRSR